MEEHPPTQNEKPLAAPARPVLGRSRSSSKFLGFDNAKDLAPGSDQPTHPAGQPEKPQPNNSASGNAQPKAEHVFAVDNHFKKEMAPTQIAEHAIDKTSNIFSPNEHDTTADIKDQLPSHPQEPAVNGATREAEAAHFSEPANLADAAEVAENQEVSIPAAPVAIDSPTSRRQIEEMRSLRDRLEPLHFHAGMLQGGEQGGKDSGVPENPEKIALQEAAPTLFDGCAKPAMVQETTKANSLKVITTHPHFKSEVAPLPFSRSEIHPQQQSLRKKSTKLGSQSQVSLPKSSMQKSNVGQSMKELNSATPDLTPQPSVSQTQHGSSIGKKNIRSIDTAKGKRIADVTGMRETGPKSLKNFFGGFLKRSGK